MDWEQWFVSKQKRPPDSGFPNYIIRESPKLNGDDLEPMYQAFKARLIEELDLENRLLERL